ncbi:hypothetical protein VNI00_007367 [Paramarasmius palmivorus]|uniref:Uncharacterized protein n=1 Tax=Paramarasmius palmivorus TaxID=297713 RepID=A0AAW0D3I1_9AGAR
MLLNEQSLQALARHELQKLARTHKVKANSKSIVIIKDLLKKFPSGVPLEVSEANVATAQAQKPAAQAEQPAPSTPAKRSRRTTRKPATTTNVTPSSTHSSPSSASAVGQAESSRQEEQQQLDDPAQIVRAATPRATQMANDDQLNNSPQIASSYAGQDDYLPDGSVTPDYMPGTPISSRESSPERPASPTVLNHAVEVIRQVTEKDRTMYKQILELQSLGKHLRDKTTALQAVLQREREQRHRIISFLHYHVANNNRWGTGRVQDDELLPEDAVNAVREEYLKNGGRGWKDDGKWTFEEIWGGKIRLAPNLDPSKFRLGDWEEVDEVHEDQYLDQYETLLDAGALPKRDEPVIHEDPLARHYIEDHFRRRNTRKRRASDEDADGEGQGNARHQARRRIASIPTSQLVGIQKPDKGKGRMSVLEVERMEKERQSERLETQAARDAEEQETQRQGLHRLDLEMARKLAQNKVRGQQDSEKIRGAILKVATDALGGAAVTDKMEKVLRIGLDRLGVISLSEGGQLAPKVLAEIALANFGGA